jgi:hypothetical protein
MAGFQVPVMPFVEVVGSIGAVDPVQIGFTAAKVGVIFGLTVITIVALDAHCPGPGVNV